MLEKLKLKRNIENSNLSLEDKEAILKLLDMKFNEFSNESLTMSEEKCPTCGK